MQGAGAAPASERPGVAHHPPVADRAAEGGAEGSLVGGGAVPAEVDLAGAALALGPLGVAEVEEGEEGPVHEPPEADRGLSPSRRLRLEEGLGEAGAETLVVRGGMELFAGDLARSAAALEEGREAVDRGEVMIPILFTIGFGGAGLGLRRPGAQPACPGNTDCLERSSSTTAGAAITFPNRPSRMSNLPISEKLMIGVVLLMVSLA